ncbi:MAG: hypothetical protein KG029_12245 [Bacteroidetes bacterium]|nr:hypothetical protein [Bacteroidota bacterium]
MEKNIILLKNHFESVDQVQAFLSKIDLIAKSKSSAYNTAALLYFSAIAPIGSESEMKKGLRFETIEILDTLTQHLRSHRPDGNPETDIRKLLWVDITFDSVRLFFEDTTVFAGEPNTENIKNIVRIPGDLFRQIYVNQF